MKPTVRIMIVTGIILGLILDMVCYKYRRLANLILYIEGVHGLLFTMIPSTYWLELPIVFIGIYYFVMFTCFYCGRAAPIIFLSFCLAFQILVIQTLGYEKSHYTHILGGITMIVIFFVVCSFIAMLIVYTTNLEQKKANALKANIQCIEGMHEGLLILSKRNEANAAGVPEQLFCNKPARKLLGTFLGGGNYSSVNIQEYL